MADNSKIEWTDATWNPVTGCAIKSPGCIHCYAMTLAATRLQHHPSRAGLTEESKNGPVWNGKVRLNEAWLEQPLRWRKPRKIFVCAHGDLFYEAVPDEWIDKVFAVMVLAPQHSFQVPTKRPERMRAYIRDAAVEARILIQAHRFLPKAWRGADPAQWGSVRLDLVEDTWHLRWPLPNVWLGVSAERQQEADERIPLLLDTPAALRFVSLEPLLGPVDLTNLDADPGAHGISSLWREGAALGLRPMLDWVIVGGESGKGARPMHPDWARALRDQCQAADVAFFFKQWGEWCPPRTDLIPVPRERLGWVHVGSSKLVSAKTEADLDVLTREENRAHRSLYGHMAHVGKKRAGRLLDGRTWDEMPTGT